jgi:dTDP-4-dehydrorhamnose 3,5-epimerase
VEQKETGIVGAWIIERDVHRDTRGGMMETFHHMQLAQLGIIGPSIFVQGNESVSRLSTLRGLHYQLKHPQAKLCWVSCGEALDVIVDIRQGSPTEGVVKTVKLAAGSGTAVYIPRGCAHGFLALDRHTVFQYLVDDYYAPDDQHGIIWNDPTLAIDWKTTMPLLSEKDQALPTLQQADHLGLLPRY